MVEELDAGLFKRPLNGVDVLHRQHARRLELVSDLLLDDVVKRRDV